MLGGNPSFTFSFFFLSHEVVASIATLLYLLLLVFLCQVSPLMHRKCEVLFCCPEIEFCPLLFENLKILWILTFSKKKLDSKTNTFIYISLVFYFSDLSYRSASKNSIFTDCSDFDRFCLYFAFEIGRASCRERVCQYV